MKKEKRQNEITVIRRRGMFIGAALLTALVLGGCGVQMPDLTEEQTELVGEYAANLLLKYDSNHRKRLLSLEEMEKEENRRASWAVKFPTATPEPEKPQESQKPSRPESEPGEGKPASYGKLGDVFDFPENVEITYLDYELSASYPKQQSGVFSLDASSGKKLLVLRFSLKNDGEGAQNIDLVSADISYKITVNGSDTKSSLPTFLDDDLSTYQGKLMPGANQEVVLIREVENDTEIDSLRIKLKNGAVESNISLK